MATAIDDQIVEDQDIVIGVDSLGHTLTQTIIAERLVVLDCTEIRRASDLGDYEYLADKLSDGWRGYHRMSPGELWTEYKEVEDTFLSFLTQGLLVMGLKPEDPLSEQG